MKYYAFKKQPIYKIAFLVTSLNIPSIKDSYLIGLDLDQVVLLELYKDPTKKKTAVKDMKEFLEDAREFLKEKEIEYVAICQSDYFKTFAKEVKADVHIGYIKEVESYKVLYVPDFKSIFYDPDKIKGKIQRSIQALQNALQGTYEDPGNIKVQGQYPKTPEEINKALKGLFKYDALTCDIETFSLRPHLAGIGSIAFAWNQNEGIAFQVDTSPENQAKEIRQMLRAFFQAYQGKLIFHNIAFDATVLIYQLFMDDITDTEGLYYGMQYLLKNFEDTKLIAYLATNSCAGNELGLKALAQEFTGNYAQDEIADIRKIPVKELLEYNLTDCLSTWFVYNKYRPVMLQDEQEDIYNKIFIPSTRDIIQMQLTGFPLNMQRVLEVEQILIKDQQEPLKILKKNPIIQNYVDVLKQAWVDKRNSELKTKRVTIDDAKVEFNPRSHQQLQELFYGICKLPVINKTASKLPATDADTLKALKNHTKDPEVLEILQALVDFSAVDKILTAFIPAFKEAVYSKKENWYYLIGNFNLGGTVSGRLSSSNPNLQQLPATGSKYAKIIKSCFQAPEGWLLCGLDFASLEDHISALTTKDHNKLKVYIDHYDGHCLRAFSYWKDLMPDINEALNEIHKEGKVFKVTHDDGSVEYLNEFNPKLKELQNAL